MIEPRDCGELDLSQDGLLQGIREGIVHLVRRVELRYISATCLSIMPRPGRGEVETGD